MGADYLFLVRHGDTEANEKGINAGPLAFPLDKKGKKAVEYVSKTLSDIEISAIYCSPILRAVETAEIVAEPHDLKVKTMEELSEAKLKPTYIGRNTRSNILKNPEAYQETYVQLEKRTLKGISMIRSTEKGNVVAVSHGDPLMALLHYTVDRRLAKNKSFFIHPEPGSLCIFDLKKRRPTLILFNYHRKQFSDF